MKDEDIIIDIRDALVDRNGRKLDELLALQAKTAESLTRIEEALKLRAYFLESLMSEPSLRLIRGGKQNE